MSPRQVYKCLRDGVFWGMSRPVWSGNSMEPGNPFLEAARYILNARLAGQIDS